MEESNNEQYVYLFVERTLSRDKTTLEYGITPFKTLDAVNDAVLDAMTYCAKHNKGDINYLSYIPHDKIDKDEYGHINCGTIDFKSGAEKKYAVLLRKIN